MSKALVVVHEVAVARAESQDMTGDGPGEAELRRAALRPAKPEVPVGPGRGLLLTFLR